MTMHIVHLTAGRTEWAEQAAALLVEAFPHAYPDMPSARAEIVGCLAEDRIALAAVTEGMLIGFIGAIPQYGATGWELHPLAVARAARRQGAGTALVRRLEDEVRARGGIVLYLGSDDESGQTTLANIDLYDQLWERVRDIRNPGGHPYEFYQKLGYRIVGVIPDANGLGKPDIIMSRRLFNPDTE